MGASGYGFEEFDVEVAGIMSPPPPSEDEAGGIPYEVWLTALVDVAEGFCFERSELDGGDPLVRCMEELRRRRGEIEQQMVLLAAYMRTRVRPRPYTLKVVADAAGLTPSGVRTFYSEADVAELDERIREAKRALPVRGHRPGSVSEGEGQ